MATTYKGLLVRDGYDDTGQIPSPGSGWPFSPDIIPYGTGTLTSTTAVSTWSGPNDIGVPVSSGAVNNIYIRCQNISDGPMTGTVNLYFVNSSLLLTPITWQPITVPTTAGTLVSTASGASTTIPKKTDPGTGIAIVQAPFQISGVPSGAHYCFLCRVNNNGIPIPLPSSFSSNAALQQWFRQNPNISFRNIILGAGTTASTVTFHTFGNINPVTSTMIFSMEGTNLPPGTTWSAACSDSRVPFSASGTFSSAGTAAVQLDVPPHIDGTTGNRLASMGFTFTNPQGVAFPTNAKVRIRLLQSPSSPLLEFEEELSEVHRVAPLDDRVAADADGLVEATLILIGAVDVWLTTQSSRRSRTRVDAAATLAARQERPA